MTPKKKAELITLKEALQLSNGYFTHLGSIRNLVCAGKLKRFGPPRRVMLDKGEFLDYMGQPQSA